MRGVAAGSAKAGASGISADLSFGDRKLGKQLSAADRAGASYAVILGGSVLEVAGFNLNLIHTIPAGLWEVFTGVWLIVKGFDKSPLPIAAERTTSSTPSILPSSAVRSATA